jgi:hypothetical protein
MLSDFVTKLPPADQVALVTVPHGGIKVGLTTDRARYARGHFKHQSDSADRRCALPDARHLVDAPVHDRTVGPAAARSQSSVAFLSASLTGISQAEAAQDSDRPPRGGVSSQGGACYLTGDDFKRVGTAVGGKPRAVVHHPSRLFECGRAGRDREHQKSDGRPVVSLVGRYRTGAVSHGA